MEVRRGFTLIETVVAASLFALVMGLVVALFTISKKNQEATMSSLFLSREMENAVRWLRRDLQETCLGSISVEEASGVALLSCRAYANDSGASQKGLFGKLSLSPQGVPAWKKVVLYTVVPNPQSRETGTLTRWEVPYAEGPIPGSNLTSDLRYRDRYRPAQVDGKTADALLRDTMMANIELKDQSGKVLGDPYRSDAAGGFRVSFVRADETLSTNNPANTTVNVSQNTRLLEVQLKTLRRGTSGQDSFLALKFRVCPRY